MTSALPKDMRQNSPLVIYPNEVEMYENLLVLPIRGWIVSSGRRPARPGISSLACGLLLFFVLRWPQWASLGAETFGAGNSVYYSCGG
jgi:hypothetical protein